MQKSRSLLLVVMILAGLLLAACAAAPAQAPVAGTAATTAATADDAAPAKAKRVGYAVPDASNPFLANLTKNVTFTVTDATRDKVIYLSDKSPTPLTQ